MGISNQARKKAIRPVQLIGQETMKTEITELTAAWSAYTYPTSEAAFYDAERVLLKFHNKYGTIDIPTIKQLIR